MTTLRQWQLGQFSTTQSSATTQQQEREDAPVRPEPHLKLTVDPDGLERREHRRHEMDRKEIPVERWDGSRRAGTRFGTLVDLSAGGMRVRTDDPGVRPDTQIRVRLRLPVHAGISPFVTRTDAGLRPSGEWVGWLTVTRVERDAAGHAEIAGRLVDMDDIDRGMLGLYLSTHPLAA